MSASLNKFPKSKVIDVYIARYPDATAKTPEQHSKSDFFQLRAKTAGGTDILLGEASGEQNLPMLEEAKQTFIRSLEDK